MSLFGSKRPHVPAGPHRIDAHWLLPFRLDTLDELKRVRLASARLRAGVAVAQAGATGDSDAAAPGIFFTAGDAADAADRARVLVIGKIIVNDDAGRARRWLEMAVRVRRSGGTVIVDYTDDHLSFDSPYAPFYEAILDVADAAVAPSEFMQSRLRSHWPGPVSTIEDAVEFGARPPRQAAGIAPVALWFGHDTNLPYLLAFLRRWQPEHEVHVLVLCGNAAHAMDQWKQVPAPPRIKAEFRDWSPQAMVAAADSADYCILPSDPADPRKNAASANRLITALALGMPTAADVLASYREFGDCFVDIRSREFADLATDPSAYHAVVKHAQHTVVPRFSPRMVGGKWLRLLRQHGSRRAR